MNRQLLIIDDDRLFSDAVAEFFSHRGVSVSKAHSKKDGLSLCQRNRADVVLLDQKLPDGNGIDLCASILQSCELSKIIFITAFPSFDHAVKALRQGAHDYLSKPLELEELAMTVEQAFRTVELERVECIHQFNVRRESRDNVMVGLDGGLSSLKKEVELAAANAAPVLITGETGTGKNVVAKTIHYLANSKSTPFIEINCAALPENLIEVELFGCEKGAFTGADSARKGIFEMADGGTLFLDEIGELPLHLQAKLLGVLDNGTLRRLGDQTVRKVDVRLIAATNRILEDALSAKEFRQDLYYRLSVMRIHIPPLRQRVEDIDALCRHFITTFAPDKKLVLGAEDLAALRVYPWPGNVRELRNIVERSIILRSSSILAPARLIVNPGSGDNCILNGNQLAEKDTKTRRTLAEWEVIHIGNTLESCNNNRTHTAKVLGISRSTLMRKMNTFGIKTGEPK